MTDLNDLKANLRTTVRGIAKVYKLKAEATDDPPEDGLAWAADVAIAALQDLRPRVPRQAAGDQRPIPAYLINSAIEYADPDDEYVIVRSDNDFQTAGTLPEANRHAEEMRSEIDTLSPIPHTVQVVELQKVPPEA